jgi:hypothetical protein
MKPFSCPPVYSIRESLDKTSRGARQWLHCQWRKVNGLIGAGGGALRHFACFRRPQALASDGFAVSMEGTKEAADAAGTWWPPGGTEGTPWRGWPWAEMSISCRPVYFIGISYHRPRKLILAVRRPRGPN